MRGERGDSYALGRRPALDGLRGWAVLLVVISHSIPPANSAGTVGVTLFFVLSGFLITRLLLEERVRTGRIDLRRFISRRARRLVPALTLFLLAALAVCVRSDQPLSWVLAAALYAANVVMAGGTDMHFLGHTWSLALEEQFYLVWPPLLLLILRLRERWAIAIPAVAVLVVLVWRAVLLDSGHGVARVAFGPDTRVDALVAGCALAFQGNRLSRIPGPVVAAAALGLLLLCLPVHVEASAALMPMVTLGAAVVVGRAASASAPAVLEWRPARELGRISYGVYLWHNLVAWLFVTSLPAYIGALVVLLLSVGVAAVSWRFVESPILEPRRSGAAMTGNDVRNGRERAPISPS